MTGKEWIEQRFFSRNLKRKYRYIWQRKKDPHYDRKEEYGIVYLRINDKGKEIVEGLIKTFGYDTLVKIVPTIFKEDANKGELLKIIEILKDINIGETGQDTKKDIGHKGQKKVLEKGIKQKVEKEPVSKIDYYLADKILNTLFLKEAYNIRKSIIKEHLKYEVDNYNIDNELEYLKNNNLITIINNKIYLTKRGYNVVKGNVIGHEYTSKDEVDHIILNPIARKAIFVLEKGMSVSQISEKIGYSIEERIFDKISINMHKKVTLEEVYRVLQILDKYNIISVKYNNIIKESSVITWVNKDKLSILKVICMIVEYLPTILISDKNCISPLFEVLNHFEIKNKMASFFDSVFINGVSKDFLSKISCVERLFFYEQNIDKIIKDSHRWRYLTLKELNNKHYFMLKNSDYKK